VLPAAATLSSLIAHAPLEVTPPRNAVAVLGLVLWALGALFVAVLIALAQRRFRRGLEPLLARSAATVQSATIAGPMVVGTWRPKVVLPADFAARYNAVERELVLAHEHAHLERRDPLVNALAAAVLCFNWFNPLLYWALGRFRFDQELACDATVLARNGTRRRSYADALLKTQLANDSRGESHWFVPVGCPWQPTHPLTERIAMLKLPLPGTLRRRTGVTLLAIVTFCAGYACWAAQSAGGATRIVKIAAVAGPPIAMHMKWIISDKDTRTRTVLVTNVIVPAGNAFTLSSPGKAYEAHCTPSLAARGHEHEDPILVKCTLDSHGQILGTPSVLVADGSTAAVEVDATGPAHFRLEINASTKPRNVAAVSEDDAGGAEDEAEAAGDMPDAGDAPEVPDVPDVDVPEPPEPPRRPAAP
jgi:beta-lactamase regulating signal transducer with metallopeptidase domain